MVHLFLPHPLPLCTPAWLAAISLTKFAHKSACKVLPACENACGCLSPPGGALITLKCGRRCAAAAGEREGAAAGEREEAAEVLHLEAASSLFKNCELCQPIGIDSVSPRAS